MAEENQQQVTPWSRSQGTTKEPQQVQQVMKEQQ